MKASTKASASIAYREFAPPPALSRLVVAGCAIQTGASSARLRILPDACDYIVFRANHGLRLISGRRETHEQTAFAANESVTGFKLRPGSLAALLDLDARDLDSHGLLDIGDCRERLDRKHREVLLRWEDRSAEDSTAPRLLDSLATAVGVLARNREVDRKLEFLAALQSGFRNAPETRLKNFAQEAGISLRTLERRVQESCGLSPARFRSIVRFFGAYRMLSRSIANDAAGKVAAAGMGDAGRSLTDVAHDAGYADQAHFIREFRRFAGLRPRDARLYPERFGLNPAALPKS
ncbi:MAG: helix-turn-helix domain-containing protein [bacterium]|nr:helix-turn-helix domain-containing protein [bacterium]